jgi:hypothetical protein
MSLDKLLRAAPVFSLALFCACADDHATARGFAPTAPSAHDALATSTAAQTRNVLPTGKGVGVQDDTAPPPRTRYRIEYHNNPVMLGTVAVYVIYYGNWTATDEQIIADFTSNLGLSSYFRPVTLYPNAVGQTASEVLYYGGSTVDLYSHGNILSDADVPDIVVGRVAAGTLPQDPSGIFVVMASPDITASSGLDSTYCAFHGTTIYSGTAVRYAFIGGPARSQQRCAPQAVGPNGTLGPDAAVSILGGQLFNIITDPDLNAWYDKIGLEAADKCAWTFGTTYKAPNGALANVHLGQRDFLLQQMWVPNKNGGSCRLGI